MNNLRKILPVLICLILLFTIYAITPAKPNDGKVTRLTTLINNEMEITVTDDVGIHYVLIKNKQTGKIVDSFSHGNAPCPGPKIVKFTIKQNNGFAEFEVRFVDCEADKSVEEWTIPSSNSQGNPYRSAPTEPLPGKTIFSTPRVIVSIFAIAIAIIIGLIVRCYRRMKKG